MTAFRVQEAAAFRIGEIFSYTRKHWGDVKAEAYITGLFDAFAGIASHEVLSRPVPPEFEVDGYYFRYQKHFVYWKWLENGDVGIVAVLHQRMHQIDRFKDDIDV